MAKTRQQKEQDLVVLKEKFAEAKGVVFARYMGLGVADIQELRKKLREEDSEMIVSKKSLIKLMLDEKGLNNEVVNNMDTGVAVVFGYKDEVAPAKVVAEFGSSRDDELVGFYAGVLEGELIDAEKVVALSKLPSRQELLAKMVGSMMSPLTGFVNVLSGNTRGLVNVLNQIKESKA